MSNPDAADTRGSSIIADHLFLPRTEAVLAERLDESEAVFVAFPPNPYLCEVCRLAEAAHLPREEKP
jgi:hypothetical protein